MTSRADRIKIIKQTLVNRGNLDESKEKLFDQMIEIAEAEDRGVFKVSSFFSE